MAQGVVEEQKTVEGGTVESEAGGEGEANPDREFDRLKGESETFFKERVSPFVSKYCLACHSSKRPTEAGVNFSPALKRPAHAAFSQQWKKGVARVKVHDMPPDYAEEQPTDEERQMFVEWQGKIKYLSEKDPGPFIIRRLTKTEYGNTLRDLFGVDPAIAGGLPDEVSGEGYLNSLSPLQLDQYLSIAEKVLDEISAAEGAPPTEVQVRLFGEPPSPEQDVREAARRVARSLARKAYRRPASDAEEATLLKVFDLGRENGLEYAGALQLMLKGILVSPQFLFITPSGEITGAGESEPGVTIVPLDDYQLASRLSYLLWASMPDEELMRIADAGGLHEPATLRVQVERLLTDPRSRALFDGFGAQWLGLGDLKEKTFDPERFPQMTSEMRAAMYDEARLFFESIVRENLSVSNFVESDFTFLNETLATIYGMEETVTGAEMRRVALTDENRGGVLGMPGILAATSLPNRTSPVKRGVWVLEQILGEHVPPPPADVPALEKQDQATVKNLTLRERTELHRTNAVCANCHNTLDPIGFGLENFDAIGRWRVQDDNGEMIDASGELPGGKHFSSPVELKAIIAGRTEELSRTLVEKLLAYTLCRRLEGYDEIVVDKLMKEIAVDGYRMQTLVTAVVTSYPFTHRRIQEDPKSHGENKLQD